MEDNAYPYSDRRDQVADALMSLSNSGPVIAHAVGANTNQDQLAKDVAEVFKAHDVDAWLLTCPRGNLLDLTVIRSEAFERRSRSLLLHQLPALVIRSLESQDQSASDDSVLEELGLGARHIAERFARPLHDSVLFNGGDAGMDWIRSQCHIPILMFIASDIRQM
jgi:hypothetical protein